MGSYGDSLVYKEEQPWEAFGADIRRAPSPGEALAAAGIGWSVEARAVPGRPDLAAAVRREDGAILGYLPAGAAPLQNAEAFAFTADLLAQGARYEAGGALDGGRRTWLLLRLPGSRQVGGAITVPFLLAVHAIDRPAGPRLYLCPARIASRAVLSFTLRTAPRRLPDAPAAAAPVLEGAAAYLAALDALAMRLLSVPLPRGGWPDLVARLLPASPPRRGPGATEHSPAARRSALLERIREPDLQPIRTTGWGAACAVATFATTLRWGPFTAETKERQFCGLIDGFPLLDRALALLGYSDGVGTT